MAACRHCGREAHERDQFCQYCGHRLDAGASEPAQAALVPAMASVFAVSAHPTPALWHGGADDQPRASANGAQQPSMETHVSEPSPPESDPEMRSRLLIRKASVEHGDEREEVLGDRDVAIGRSPSCDIVLDGDELASRRHGLIRAKGDGYTLVDLGSSNGTYVNGYEIHGETRLQDGDRIAIGSHELTFAIGTPGPNAALAGERAGNLPPRRAAATQHPTGQADSSGEAGGEQAAPALADAPAEGEEAAGETLDQRDDESADAASPSVSRAESQTAPLSAATPEELEALRLQIADIAGALARKADTETRAAKHFHAALAEAREQLAALLREAEAAQRDEDQAHERAAELAAAAREAADHPRHLDYLTRLAEHADEIARTLDAQPRGAALIDSLRNLLARIDDQLA
ncbi:MAG: FHA domain-containing protein [Ktedonobacterales bacterium]